MTNSICLSATLDRPWAQADVQPTTSPLQRWLDRLGWSRWRLARARAALLCRAAEIESTQPSHAADLRAAALAGTDQL